VILRQHPRDEFRVFRHESRRVVHHAAFLHHAVDLIHVIISGAGHGEDMAVLFGLEVPFVRKESEGLVQPGGVFPVAVPAVEFFGDRLGPLIAARDGALEGVDYKVVTSASELP